jgi:hypothetical protein
MNYENEKHFTIFINIRYSSLYIEIFNLFVPDQCKILYKRKRKQVSKLIISKKLCQFKNNFEINNNNHVNI